MRPAGGGLAGQPDRRRLLAIPEGGECDPFNGQPKISRGAQHRLSPRDPLPNRDPAIGQCIRHVIGVDVVCLERRPAQQILRDDGVNRAPRFARKNEIALEDLILRQLHADIDVARIQSTALEERLDRFGHSPCRRRFDDVQAGPGIGQPKPHHVCVASHDHSRLTVPEQRSGDPLRPQIDELGPPPRQRGLGQRARACRPRPCQK
ncbi:hypothetical protein [Bradyrhizobium sp. HKCCYLS20291]|uniref:hypothetical protein n=1 Tax=Bradyrhizobium sp. HKCCYLS20291 TaxID=3420766 RepID=UPI003EB9B0F3